MEKTALGSTGLLVSRLGLGTVKIGRNQGVKYPAGFELPDDRQVSRLLDLATDLGINLIDTAPAYGSSEERLGQLLKKRQNWVICSKVGEEFQNGRSSFDFSASHIRYSVERSLQRIGTDYLDIVLVHSDGQGEDQFGEGESLIALELLKREGKIRSYGVSTKTVPGGILAAHLCDVVMVTYNPASRDDERVINLAFELHKGVLVKKGLASGHLQTLAGGQDPVQQSLQFIFARPGVSSVIIGTINPAHLESNVAAAQAALAALRSAAPG